MKYAVYYCNPVESHIDIIYPENKEARFDTLEEAREYVDRQTEGYEEVDDRDADNGNDRFWYEVYEGEPITYNEKGEEILQDFKYVSEQYYYDE